MIDWLIDWWIDCSRVFDWKSPKAIFVVLAAVSGAELCKPESVESEFDKTMNKNKTPPAVDTRNYAATFHPLIHY